MHVSMRVVSDAYYQFLHTIVIKISDPYELIFLLIISSRRSRNTITLTTMQMIFHIIIFPRLYTVHVLLKHNFRNT